MHGENNGGCITRKDKSISLIPYSPRLGGTSKGTQPERYCTLGSSAQDCWRGGKGMGGRGHRVNLCIIRQRSDSERKRGITKTWLSQQKWSMTSLSCHRKKKYRILFLNADMEMKWKHAEGTGTEKNISSNLIVWLLSFWHYLYLNSWVARCCWISPCQSFFLFPALPSHPSPAACWNDHQ